MTASTIPFQGAPPPEVPLKHAPLVRVIAQVRFPVVASVEKRDFIAPFQEDLRKTYPVLRPEQSRALVFGPEGIVDTQSSVTWRFENTDGTWRVSLGPDFVALETTSYTSRNDFLSRFEQVLVALERRIEPAIVDRLGVRYIDRIEGNALQSVRELIRPEIAGILATPLGAEARQSITQNVFALPEPGVQLLARWGLIPAQATIDPAAVDAVDRPSWILDLDTFIEGPIPFEPASVVRQARNFAERIYSFFRWAVTDEFLRRYGGEL